jgi:menaquinone-dependent protoporphyrinogen oxidase
MKVLIVTASKYGSTVGVGAAIAETLRARGHHVDAHDPAAAPAPAGYDAVVVGSGVYMGSWLKPAATFLEAHAAALVERPVWLFGVGPLGAENPQPAGDPESAAKLVARVGARGYATFTGALDRGRLSLPDRLIARAVKAPDGDFRDWSAIRAWSEAVADALETVVPVGNPIHRGEGAPA